MAVKMEGPLTKWTNVVQGWQYRWFVLDEHTGLLSYYTSKDRMMRGARRGCLRLKGGKIGINDEDDSTFTITCDHRTFHFQARDSTERTQWVKCLEETIGKHSNNSDSIGDSFKVTEDELNRKMQEAEAYFRILTQQVKKLESQMNHTQGGTKSEKSLMLRDSLTQMIETMGQTIELLHNAKSSLAKKVPVPVIDGPAAVSSQRNSTDIQEQNFENTEFENGVDSSSSPSRSTKSLDTGTSSNNSRSITLDSSNSSKEVVLEVGCEATETDISSSVSRVSPQITVGATAEAADAVASNIKFVPIEPVPITTYTSSDDEDVDDEFFDANEQFAEITIDEIESSLKLEEEEELKMRQNNEADKDIIDMNVSLKNQATAGGGGGNKTTGHNRSRMPSTTARSCDSNDYEIEDEDEEENADLSSHGSVISHLLSQVRIGMDLTKVTLPTFILERRSLLEMYADFFAHPDLFKGIPDLTDPSDRMIQVLRWYLSSFHAGRKSTVAKKPYNPIIGETFQCFFELADDQAYRTNPENFSKNGPIPWGTKQDVTFVAEQVSHHPPISAFYAECEDQKVCFNSHIWTKSKFLGLSIGVHMAGSGSVFVSDYDEEYIMTFPNAYCRSILTVPWVELGGKTEITCPATGFSAQIEFLTKPFYGGKKNRLTAEVYAPSQKKPFLSVNGEWNGVMYAKRTSSSETEVFVDTFNMPIVTKKVKLIAQQEEFESRRMWNDVTIALKTNDIDGASQGKHILEEKQRQDARVRKETDSKWVTRLFDEEELEEGERVFRYKWPLYKRQGYSRPGAIVAPQSKLT